MARQAESRPAARQPMLKVQPPMTTWYAAGWGWHVKTRKGFTVGGCMSEGQAERVGNRLIDRGK